MSMVITTFLVVYLLVGFGYALWVFFFGYDRWYWFPINWMLGPLTILLMAYFTITGRRNPFGRY